MSEVKIGMIGLAGVAGAGKDTLFRYLKEEFKTKNIEAKRYSIADMIRADLEEEIRNNYGIDCWSPSPEEKEIIRPRLVEYGLQKREISNGKYFTDKLTQTIEEDRKNIENLLPIITDIRYAEYKDDELQWVKNNNGISIHISRISIENGLTIRPPANEFEEKNDPILKEESDLRFTFWDCSRGEPLPAIVDSVVCNLTPDEYFKNAAKYVIEKIEYIVSIKF